MLEIIETELQAGTLHGVIVQFGGQTPLKLARALGASLGQILGSHHHVPVLAHTNHLVTKLQTAS